MVESIGPRPVTNDVKVQRTSLAKAIAPVTTGTAGTGDTAALSNVAKTMAATPPVDTDRVARVKRAIERGDFPILPATIADRMIALKYDWMSSDDQA